MVPCSCPLIATQRPGEGQSSMEHLYLCVSLLVFSGQETFSDTQFLPTESQRPGGGQSYMKYGKCLFALCNLYC